MRKRRNGFTKFMSKLDDKDGVSRKVDTPYFTPESLSILAVGRTLEDMETRGDASSLAECFVWRNTPQGYGYWCDIAEGRAVIDREGLDYLHWLLEHET